MCSASFWCFVNEKRKATQAKRRTKRGRFDERKIRNAVKIVMISKRIVDRN